MITFKKIRWKNFLSTGNVFTEINLTENKTNLIIGQNGAGKSTILDALTFSLFGKPFRKINKPMLVNSINDKDCLTEIEFCIGKNLFLIRRGIKPSIFEVYQNGALIDQSSTTADYQNYLEKNILKMNYKSFTQIVVLGSSTFVPFMRLPLAARREIIEDILDIQIFSVMNGNLKEKLKFSNDDIKDRDYLIDITEEKVLMQKNFIANLDLQNQNDIQEKNNKIIHFTNLEKDVSDKLQQLNEERSSVTIEMDQFCNASEKLKKLGNLRGKIQQKFSSHKKEHQFFTENTTCPTCTQHISEDLRDTKVSEIMNSIKELKQGMEEMEMTIKLEEERESKFTELSRKCASIFNEIQIQQFQISSYQSQIRDLQKEISQLQNNNSNRNEEDSKLHELEKSLREAKDQMIAMKEERDCLLAAGQLLKDNGIKTRIIKKYLPPMNKLINEYLQNMDFYVNFTLDENFEETIKSRYRDIFSYESFSEGEKARIDIALLLTWRSVAKLKNSVDTNLLILDEIFDGSLDQNGTGELGWILKNFDDNTNIFVISHKENMSDKFDRTIKFEKVKNFSVPRETVSEVD
jgi:DNA repair exonuclease SbcCD ATPase subunit